jgi:putative ABC transport system permease protein
MEVKEIGIRKVLVVSTVTIIKLITKEFFSIIVLANLIAWPLANFLMRNWLENFCL